MYTAFSPAARIGRPRGVPLPVGASSRGPRAAPAGKWRGFSLVEVLIAVIVLTVGLLGVAALQGIALKTTDSAQMTTLATIAVYDAVERLRAAPRSLMPASGGKVSIVKCGAADQPSGGTAALTRWRESVCDSGLRQTASQTNAMTIDCTGTKCGTGNCEVRVFWGDSRAMGSLARKATTSGGRSLSVCTRLPQS